MGDGKWERLSRQTVFSCPYYKLSHDRYRLPAGGIGDYHYVDIPGSTMIVPLLEDGNLIVVGQYRYLMGRYSLEFPAGGMKAGYEARFNAEQELREEAGYEASRWEKIGEFAPYNGVSNELCHVYLAERLRAVRAEPEPTEEFRIFHLSPEAVREKIASGELWDGMTIASFRFFEIWGSRHEPDA